MSNRKQTMQVTVYNLVFEADPYDAFIKTIGVLSAKFISVYVTGTSKSKEKRKGLRMFTESHNRL